MKQTISIHTALTSILILFTTLSYSAETKNFHGIQSGNIDALKYVEQECPAMIKQWLIVREIHKEIPGLYATFGSTKRKSAERKGAQLVTKLKSTRNKYKQLYSTCETKLEQKLKKSSKSLSSLQKKKTASAATQKKIEALQEEITNLKNASAALERINPSTYSIRLLNQLQRLKIDAGAKAKTKLIEDNPSLVDLRMKAQDYIADIKTIQTKDADKLTATDKQKKRKAQQQLKTTYLKLEKACTTHKRNINTQLAKHKKDQTALIAKIEKSEKANRSTDKYDRERMLLIQEIGILNYQLELVDKILDCPEAKK